MSEKVRMNYATMREMTKAFEQAHQQLEDTIRAVKKQGEEMLGGGLQGQAGQTFVDAINGPLVGALQDLSAKMQEMGEEVEGARKFLEEGVKTAKNRFTN